MTKLPQRKPQRMRGYDYSSPWWYFVTVCTNKMNRFFGKVENGKMILNDLGNHSEKFWLEIPSHYRTVELDEFIIMPNHLHGIIIIETAGNGHARSNNVPTLGNIIGSLKSAVSKWAHQNGYPDFKWQRSFYDRIIRN